MSLTEPERSPGVVVTVAMPVLNGGLDLALAIRSICNQSFKHWELLILDDGSTDGSLERLDVNDDRVVVLRDSQNRGLSARLNQAVARARGRYFARMDHDDVSHPERLFRQFEFLEAHPGIDLLGTRCVTIDEEERLLGELPQRTTHQEICRRPWLGFYLAHPTWMGRTEWFRRNPYRDPGPYRCEDQELLLRTYEMSQFAALPDPLLAYRVRRHTRLSTLFRTRLAMVVEQVRYFSRTARYDFCALATLAAVGRMLSDTLSWRGGRAPPWHREEKRLPGEMDFDWQRWFREIRRERPELNGARRDP